MSLPTTLDGWLSHCERLHPKEIDMGLERVALLRDRLGIRFQVSVITVGGTNGKGSTCAMLESIARHAGYRVGLYIKPHLVHFEERCLIRGLPVTADELLPHFAAVEAARGETTLTWHEYTTLVILRCLAQAPLDLVILEVGLGGRLDAVNAIDADCAVITSIALDHTAFLGPDRASIAREKAGIMRPGRPVIVSDPEPPHTLLEAAEATGSDLWLLGRDFRFAAQAPDVRQQWRFEARGRRLHGLAYPALRGANQLQNAAGALAALEALRPELPINVQAVRTGLAMVELPGRFQTVPGQPALVLDVAHNAQSVAALALNLDQMGFFPRTLAVFGAMRDKDLDAALKSIAPLVDGWFLTALPPARAASTEELQAAVARVGPAPGATVQTFADPETALRAAAAAADPADRIVVFGSFYTVGGVMARGVPRLQVPAAAQPAPPAA